MKIVNFTACAKRLAYSHVYGLATMFHNAGITPRFEYMLNDAIQDIRKFSVQAEVDHGIVLEMTDSVMEAIEEYAHIGWRIFLAHNPVITRIESIGGLLPFLGYRRKLEMVTRTAFYVHQGEAQQLVILPIDSSSLSVKLTYLDCMATLIKESK